MSIRPPITTKQANAIYRAIAKGEIRASKYNIETLYNFSKWDGSCFSHAQYSAIVGNVRGCIDAINRGAKSEAQACFFELVHPNG